jgi:hypothetical protein
MSTYFDEQGRLCYGESREPLKYYTYTTDAWSTGNRKYEYWLVPETKIGYGESSQGYEYHWVKVEKKEDHTLEDELFEI